MCAVLWDPDPKDKDQAIEGLLQYQAKGKGLGEMAADKITKAAKATDDADTQAKLGLKAFLKAVPEGLGRELRCKHFQSVREALKEARFLQALQDNGNLDWEKGKVMAMGSEEVKEKKSEADLGEIVEECLKQLQAQASVSNKNERPGNAKHGKCRCWCCGKEGHFLMQCPTVKQNRAAQKEAAREKSENK